MSHWHPHDDALQPESERYDGSEETHFSAMNSTKAPMEGRGGHDTAKHGMTIASGGLAHREIDIG